MPTSTCCSSSSAWAEAAAKTYIEAGWETPEEKRHLMALPAYDQCIKASHVFNLLDARGVISVTERQSLHPARPRNRQGLRQGLARDGGRRGAA